MRSCFPMLCLSVLAACNATHVERSASDSGATDAATQDSGPSVPALDDGAYELRVDRVWNRDLSGVHLPTDAILPESGYLPDTSGITHRIIVTDMHKMVAIDDVPLQGKLTDAGSPQLTYELTGGTFAGGRFLVWMAGGELQGELTLYGSGVPIVESERGKVVRLAR